MAEGAVLLPAVGVAPPRAPRAAARAPHAPRALPPANADE